MFRELVPRQRVVRLASCSKMTHSQRQRDGRTTETSLWGESTGGLAVFKAGNHR